MIWRLFFCCSNNTLRSSWDSKAASASSTILHPAVPPFTLLFHPSPSTFHLSPSSSMFHRPLPPFALLFQPSSSTSKLLPPLLPFATFNPLPSSSSLPSPLPPFTLLFHPSPSLREVGKGGHLPGHRSIRTSFTSSHSRTAPTPQHTALLLSGSFPAWCPFRDVFWETQGDNTVCPPSLLFDHDVHLRTGSEDIMTYLNLEEAEQELVRSRWVPPQAAPLGVPVPPLAPRAFLGYGQILNPYIGNVWGFGHHWQGLHNCTFLFA